MSDLLLIPLKKNNLKNCSLLPNKEATEWNESKHPRADDGKFGSGGGNNETPKEPSKESPPLKESSKPKEIMPGFLEEKRGYKVLPYTSEMAAGSEVVEKYKKNREEGNYIIEQIIRMDDKDELNQEPHNVSIFNDYSTIQYMFAEAADTVKNMIYDRRWKKGKSWTWQSPLMKPNGKPRDNPMIMEKIYKSKAVLTTMSPKQYIEKANKWVLSEGRNDPRGEKYTKESIANIKDRIKKGLPIDTPYLEIDEDNKVVSQEGNHRSLAAIEMGLEEIPVYILRDGSNDKDTFSQKDIENLSNPYSAQRIIQEAIRKE